MMTTWHIMKSYYDAKCKCDKIIEHYSIVWSIVIQWSYEVLMHKCDCTMEYCFLNCCEHCCGKTGDCDVTKEQYDGTIGTYDKICSATMSQWSIVI